MFCDKNNYKNFTCYGRLVITPSSSNYSFRCSPNENNDITINHDCSCSRNMINIGNCSSDTCQDWSIDKNNCTVSSSGTFTLLNNLQQLSSSCKHILIGSSCKTRCEKTNQGRPALKCNSILTCESLDSMNNCKTLFSTNGPTSISRTTGVDTSTTLSRTTGVDTSTMLSRTTGVDTSTMLSRTTGVDTSTTLSRTTGVDTSTMVSRTTGVETSTMLTQSRTENAVTAHQKSGTETTVIALGVVAGVAILALVITLAFLCLRQRRKRSAPPANDYTDMHVRAVGQDTYECPLGLPSKFEPLHGVSETKNRESAMYMDIDDAEMEKANQGTQQDHGAMDNVYNSIEDCGDDKEYAQPDDLLTKMSSESKRLDQMHGQANYFVLEKQDENHEDQTNAESYFVLEKSENKSLGNVQTENESGNANRTDNYFILEEQENMQQNAENVSGDDYFLLEKEGNVEEDRTIDGTYNTLNTEIDIGCTDDYSHARTVCSSEESEPREGSADGEDYDKLFQKPNTYDVVHDSDNDYDHMNDGDL